MGTFSKKQRRLFLSKKIESQTGEFFKSRERKIKRFN